MDSWQKVKDSFNDTIKSIDDKVNIPIYHNYREAGEINDKAKHDYENIVRSINDLRQQVEHALELYGKKKMEVYDFSIRMFVKQFDRIKGVNLTEIKVNDALSKQVLSSINITETNFQIVDGVKTLIASGGAGAISGAVAFGAVGMFASASTGTAISALSGAAATNATIAWLGGGSLAAGGGGMALGAVVLGGLVAIPAIIAGGFVLNAKSKESLENAKANKARVEQMTAEADAAIAAMEVIFSRCNQMQETIIRLGSHLDRLNTKLQNMVDEYLNKYFFQRWFDSIKNFFVKVLSGKNLKIPNWIATPRKVDYSQFSEEQKRFLWIVTSVAQTTKNALDTELLSKDGTVSIESERMLELANKFMKQL